MTDTLPSTTASSEGVTASRVSQWDHSGRFVLVSMVVVALACVAAYFIAIPVMATVVSNRLPESTLDVVSVQTLRSLDASVLGGSEVPAARQTALTDAFAAMRWPDSRSRPHRLHFRKSDRLGANALALPSGDVVVTDALVNLATDDREILAVLAHEAGHVTRRHGVRSMIQASALTLLVAWVVGDVSALAVAAPTALLEARYSRAFERDADDYAVRALRLNDISPRYFADALSRLEAEHARRGQAEGTLLSYLATHPTTDDRIRRLQEQAGDASRP